MKKWHLPFLLFLVAGTILIMRQEHAPRPFQSEEGAIFGTIFHVTYQSDSSLLEEIKSELNQVDASLSMFNPESTLARLNADLTTQTDSMVRFIWTLSHEVSRATQGAFDPTVAPLVNAWGFGFKHQQLPDSLQVDSLRQLVGCQGIRIDSAGQLRKADPRMVLDFSAVAKGYGTDRVAALLRQRGIRNFMVEIGGEVVVSGTNPKGDAWRIGVSKPSEDQEGELQKVLQLTDCALATSGNYRNFYVDASGRRLAHTIDPRTGYPVQHSILSATVVAPTCAMADAFATSFMVLDLEGARRVLAAHPELKAYFILSNPQGDYVTQTSDNWDF